MPDLAPNRGELVLYKKDSSAFTDTPLGAEIERAGLDTVILVGFTANECIDTTARHAAERALDVFVVSDATASFELKGPDGQLHTAGRVHGLTLANLNAYVAEVVDTDEILKRLR